VLYKEHGDEGKSHENGRVWEQHGHAQPVHEEAGEYRRHHLGRHGGGVIEPGVFAHVAAGAHLHHHGEGVDIYSGPGNSGKSEHAVHKYRGAVGRHEGRDAEGRRKHYHAGQDGLLPAHL